MWWGRPLHTLVLLAPRLMSRQWCRNTWRGRPLSRRLPTSSACGQHAQPGCSSCRWIGRAYLCAKLAWAAWRTCLSGTNLKEKRRHGLDNRLRSFGGQHTAQACWSNATVDALLACHPREDLPAVIVDAEMLSLNPLYSFNRSRRVQSLSRQALKMHSQLEKHRKKKLCSGNSKSTHYISKGGGVNL